MELEENRWYLFLIALTVILSSFALCGELMEPDGALYAAIAKTIVLRNDWINLYVHGADWLDKPHLTFWLAAASYKVFGISAFAYKLPSFLTGLLGAGYLYLFCRDIYDRKTALISVLIFLTALHMSISTFDVRAETYLSTFIMAAIYHYDKARKHTFLHIIAGSFFAACAVMVKGIFVLIPVLAGFVIYWMLSKQYKELFKPKWWIAVILIFIFILPELYALYAQFDLHPEKIVFGQTGVSGLKFFFWDSQFGRFFNTGPIKGKGDLSFFLHTTIWAFLPWSILCYTAVIRLFKRKNRIEIPAEDIIIRASAGITFLLFSLSKFQLPHYIIILFPQLSIITALYLKNLFGKSLKTFFVVQSVLFLVVSALLITIAVVFQVKDLYMCMTIILVLLLTAFTLQKGISVQTIITRNVFLSFALMGFLYLFFYPSLLNYQGGMLAGKWLKEHYPDATAKVLVNTSSYAFDFYAQKEVQYLNTYEDLEKDKRKGIEKNFIVYTPESELSKLKNEYGAQVLKSFDYFRITKLKPKFLNCNTRSSVLEKFYLVRIP